jgi:hypothetical protein
MLEFKAVGTQCFSNILIRNEGEVGIDMNMNTRHDYQLKDRRQREFPGNGSHEILAILFS